MSSFSSSPALRWVVPGAAALAVAGVVIGSGMVAASADAGLAPRSAAELLADVRAARVDGLSGTVVQRAELGLPDLPGMGGDSSEFGSMVSGSHTLRVWYSAPDRSRIALMGTLGESDLIRDGDDVWLWSSKERTAAHLVLPDEAAGAGTAPDPQDLPLTPQQAADKALAAISPTTEVTTSGTARVAGRAAYELVLTPRAATSLVESVRIAIDGEERIPLRVRVFSKGEAEAAFEVGFTSVELTRPEAAQFSFNPPAGTTVEEVSADTLKALVSRLKDARPAATADAEPTVVGSGWGAVVVAAMPRPAAARTAEPSAEPTRELGRRGEAREDDRGWAQVVAQLPKVSGDWGSGRLLRSRLLTVVVTDDGRVAAGAVTPAAVYAALR